MYKLFMQLDGMWLPVGNMRTAVMGRMVALSLINDRCFNNIVMRLDVIDDETYKVVSEFWFED